MLLYVKMMFPTSPKFPKSTAKLHRESHIEVCILRTRFSDLRFLCSLDRLRCDVLDIQYKLENMHYLLARIVPRDHSCFRGSLLKSSTIYL